MTKERPILFSTPMVQAILEGRKTMTRRGLKQVVHPDTCYFKRAMIPHDPFFVHQPFDKNLRGVGSGIKCPYGKPVDLLWVRETWSEYYDPNGHPHTPLIAYKADGTSNPNRWRPSIHMPKAAARIWLEVTNVRVERLQGISEEDAICEGAKDTLRKDDMKILEGLGDWEIPSPFHPHQFGFLSIWCQINGCESWLGNPWVWVVEFKVISKTGKPSLNQ